MHSHVVSTPSIWTDVRWDPAATDDLVRQLLATADAVGEVIAVLEGDGPVVAEEWGGPHRWAYDDDRRQLTARARDVAEQLVATAAFAAARAEAAAGEQRLRVRLRQAAAVG